MLATITGRTIQEEARNPTINVVMRPGTEDGAGWDTSYACQRVPPGAQSPVKLRQTYSRDAFRRRTKPKYRKRY